MKCGKFELYSSALIISIFVGLPFVCFAYDDETTHPALTQEILKFYNTSYPVSSFSVDDGEFIIQGSIDEDTGIRALNHFYDPVKKRGLTLVEAGVTKTWPSSKEWGTDTDFQASFVNGRTAAYFASPVDYSWDRAVYEYVWGDRARGLKGLGHVLHLLEDASVPDHTRNDPHPPYLNTVFGEASPYEAFTKKFTRKNISIDGLGSRMPVGFWSIGSYFDSLARYSNSNFFSKDTILKSEYLNPVLDFDGFENLGDVPFKFGYRSIDKRAVRVVQYLPDLSGASALPALSVDSSYVLEDYWRLLSRQAVLHGAGVLNLFRQAVAEEQRTHVLRDKNTSALAKIMDKMVADSKMFLLGASGPDAVATIASAANVTDFSSVSPEMHTISAVPFFPPPQTISVVSTFLIQSPTPERLIQSAVAAKEPVPQTVSPPALSVVKPALALVPGFGGGVAPPSLVESTTFVGGSSFNSDALPPRVSFQIEECAQSLSLNTCVITGTEVHLVWSSSDADVEKFILSINGEEEESSATSTEKTLVDDVTAFRLAARDLTGNVSEPVSIVVHRTFQPLVINEVGWAGTDAAPFTDQWIELFNPTSETLSLSHVTLFSENHPEFFIPLVGSVPARGFYLVEVGSDVVIDSEPADLLASGPARLSASGEHLVLARIDSSGATTTLDETFTCPNWCAVGGLVRGSAISMERMPDLRSGLNQASWASNNQLITSGVDRQGNGIFGTPRRRNSVAGIINTGADIASGVHLTKAGSPYLVDRDTTIVAGSELEIDPGVVIKFTSGGSIVVLGTLTAQGTNLEPVVFTSLDDDDFGGDTNNNGPAANPAFWRGIIFKQGSDSSLLKNVIVRYAGANSAFQNANIYVENAAPTFDHLVSEFPFRAGFVAVNSDIALSNSTFRGIPETPFGSGVVLQNGTVQIENNTFENNNTGLKTSGISGSIHNNTFLNNGFRAGELSFLDIDISHNSGSGNGTLQLGNSAPGGNTLFLTTFGSRATSTFGANSDLPYLITDSVTIPLGSATQFGAGSILKYQRAGITVQGRLELNGAPDARVVFTSASDDTVGGDSDMNGATEGVKDIRHGILFAPSSTSHLENADIRFANTALTYQDPSPVALRGVSFTNDDLGIATAFVPTIDFIENILIGDGVTPSTPAGLF